MRSILHRISVEFFRRHSNVIVFFCPQFSLPARRRRTSRTMPAEAVERVEEAEKQMLFETREKGAYWQGLKYSK